MGANITIIGCGWVGSKLASDLFQRGYTVFGSTRTKEKAAELAKTGIHAFRYNTQLNSQISTEIIDNTDVLVITIPPFNKSNQTEYGNKLVDIARQFRQKTRIIFLSSIGIYPKKEGEYREDYTFQTAEKSTVLFSAEHALITEFNTRLSILRLGGLIGEDRHPAHHLSTKENVQNPQGEVNLVHRNDVISAIELIIRKNVKQALFNLVYPDHPTRKSYYLKKMNDWEIAPCTFSDAKSIHRIIHSDKISDELGFEFLQPI